MNALEDMETFVRIVEAGNITQAAEQLHVAKSVVSRRLQLLESRLGVTLLKRTTRKQSLTDAGTLYYQQCQRIIADVYEAESLVKDEQLQLSGVIKMAVPLSFGIRHLPPLLELFQNQNPNIQFELDFNDRLVRLHEEGFDLGLRIGRLNDDSLRAKHVTDFQIHLCASPGYLSQHGPIDDMASLSDHSLVRYSLAPESWQFKDNQGQLVNVTMKQVLLSNSGEFNLQWAEAGHGLVMLPDFICQASLDEGTLVSVLGTALPRPTVPCHVVYPNTGYLPLRVRRLIDFLFESFKR